MPKNKEDLKIYLSKFSNAIEPKIREILLLDVAKKFHDLVNYSISTGGKRLRPALTIISCLLLGGKIKDALYPAAGIEILHNYTLIVDDIIDKSILRRGKPSLWAKFGKSAAACAAICYSAAISQAVQKSKNPDKLSAIFSRSLKTVMDGELFDLLFERGKNQEEPYLTRNRQKTISIKDYFKMVGKKTAFLLGACCEVGGICARAREKEIKVLRSYGFNIGLAFQIQDDILDIFGEEKKFGKKIGKDILEKKGGNIVILLALQKLDRKKKRRLFQILQQGKISQKEVKESIELIRKVNVRKEAEKYARDYINKAKKSLAKLPQNKWNSILTGLADFILVREK